jgi:hypothetical protein
MLLIGNELVMELLLALAGLGGLALLLQQKPLPSKDDAEKALVNLEKDPTDPDANTVAGKYKAFVMGDYDGAMPYLVHSKDVTLKTLAEHELDPEHTMRAVQKVGMGDEWVTAAKKFPALNRIFLDRASQWYIRAWPDLDGLWKAKSREQAAKLATSRPPGVSRKGLPKKWSSNIAAPAPASIDGSVARTGSHSIKIPAGDPKVPSAENGIQSEPIPLASQEVQYSAYIRTDQTENKTDQLYVSFHDNTGGLLGISAQNIPTDTPFWNKVSGTVKVPPNTTSMRLGTTVRSKKGAVWVDDVSVLVDGREGWFNLSFEER